MPRSSRSSAWRSGICGDGSGSGAASMLSSGSGAAAIVVSCTGCDPQEAKLVKRNAIAAMNAMSFVRKVIVQRCRKAGQARVLTEDRKVVVLPLIDKKPFRSGFLPFYARVRLRYLMRWGWSASTPRRRFLSSSYSLKLPSKYSTWLSPSNARMCVAMRSRNQRS